MRAAQLFLLAALSFTSLETASAQPPAKPAELKVLDKVEGKWRFVWESKPTELEPRGSKGRGTSTNEWILDGWFQQHKGKVGDGGPEILEIWTYDPQTKTYRAWGFIGPGGGRYEGTGAWDEKSSTLTYKARAQETSPLCQRGVLSTTIIGKRPVERRTPRVKSSRTHSSS
jgi:hypothetical protein